MTLGPRETMLKRLNAYRSRKLLEAIDGALYEAADRVRAEASRLITTGSVSGKKHEPSAPGEPPNNDTGELKGSIEISRPEPFVARVTAHAGHAKPLEFGTSKMAARPFMRPARDNVAPAAKTIMLLKVRKALKGL